MNKFSMLLIIILNSLAVPVFATEAYIEGYTSGLSFAPGQQVDFHVSSSSQQYTIKITKSGLKEEVVWEETFITGNKFPIPEFAWEKGAQWPISTSFNIPKNWHSGFYIVDFITKDKQGNKKNAEHFFIVRTAKKSKKNKAIFIIPTSTYHAYNLWGGHNLYDGGHIVSTLRPMMPGLIRKKDLRKDLSQSRVADLDGPNEGYIPDFFAYMEKHNYPMWVGAAGWASYEQPFIQWAEAKGYEFDYATSEDLELRPEILDDYKLMISVGHDEYWSWNMRDAVESRIEKGLNVSWFVGNSVYWQIRYENNGNTMVSYKYDADKDPVLGTDKEHLLTTLWSDRRLKRPENHMTGLSFNAAGYARIAGSTPKSAGGYQVYNFDHWVFKGTNLKWGDQLGRKDRIVGYEVDGLRYGINESGYPVPTGTDGTPKDATILGMAPASLWSKNTPKFVLGPIPDAEAVALAMTGDRENWKQFTQGMAAMIIFKKGKGTVFNAGTTDWVWGLDGKDAAVERVTQNVLDRLMK